jgi:hypothetical protein
VVPSYGVVVSVVGTWAAVGVGRLPTARRRSLRGEITRQSVTSRAETPFGLSDHGKRDISVAHGVPRMGLVDDAVDLLTADPTLTVILATLLLLVFGGYFFLRRIVVSSVQGYQEGRQ